MLKSIVVSGKSEDEAVQSALLQLGLGRDEVSVEIIERAKAGFLGLKSAPAVVRVSYEGEEAHTERVDRFLNGLFQRMGVNAKPEITEADGVINVNLAGEDPGALIGRRGETLDAIQHLTNYVVNRGVSGARTRQYRYGELPGAPERSPGAAGRKGGRQGRQVPPEHDAGADEFLRAPYHPHSPPGG